jgi:hypothetical protein
MYITSQRLGGLNMVILEEEFYSYLFENCFFTPFLSIVFFKHSYIETKLSQFFFFICVHCTRFVYRRGKKYFKVW